MTFWRFLVVGAVLAGTVQGGVVGDWWNGRGASGDWFGLRERVEDRGLTLSGKWLGSVYGVAAGGLEQRATFDEELKFEARLDFAKLSGWEGLNGLEAVGGLRFRGGQNVNEFVGASPAFNPSSYQSGKEWRLMPFYLAYTTPELFGIPRLLTLSAGWQNPYEFFARQEDAKLFRNNVIVSGKGISSNGVGWSSSYAAWGGTLQVRPSEFWYVQGGLYMAIPGETDTANHGFGLAGAQPWDRNGWFVLGEAGVKPVIAGHSGKYAFGGYYWGLENRTFGGETVDGRYGFYWMADQVLFREPADEAVADGKTAARVEKSNQGLRWLGFLGFAPPDDNVMPFFFYTGVVYEGLIPSRDTDLAGVAFAYGSYSYDRLMSERARGDLVNTTYEAVLEFEYRFQVNRWAFVQPFAQYVIRPGGEGTVANATVLGVHFGVTF